MIDSVIHQDVLVWTSSDVLGIIHTEESRLQEMTGHAEINATQIQGYYCMFT